MSLLLDALKKAAQKKARESAEKTEGVDDTQLTGAASEDLTDTAIVDSAVTELDQDTQLMDGTELEATQLDATEVDQTVLDQTQIDPTEAKTQTQATHTLTEDEVSQFTDEDSTLLIADDESEPLMSMPDEADLTVDDVTEFMGDGRREAAATASEPESRRAGSDDTTITNPNAPILSHIEDDDLTIEQTGFQVPPADATHGELELEQIPEDEKMTLINTDTQVSGIDIDQLTNEETVTVKSTTATTRTFAPDNYDRTLLKLSDKDVSKIFPGMRPEGEAVMTPDYAKKVFMSKSTASRTYNLKVYAGMAVSLLLMVAIWGLFELQSESEMIDQSLVRLKRDPMPGVIKPKGEDPTRNLFADAPIEANQKAMELIASTQSDTTSVESSPAIAQSTDASSAMVKETEPSTVVSQVPERSSETPAETETKTVSAKVAPVATSQKTPAQQTASSPANLQLTSSRRVSEEDQLLQSAYAAYENGDMDKARRDYDRVLTLDAENRDALMGRAAIHVLDDEYQAAINKYQQVLETNPKDSLAMTSLISVANIDPQAGESQLKSLLRDQPESDYLHFALGNMYSLQMRWSEAQSAYFNALQFKPQDPNYAYNLAVSLEHMGKPQTAVNFYRQSLDNLQNGLASFDSQLVSQRIEVLSQ